MPAFFVVTQRAALGGLAVAFALTAATSTRAADSPTIIWNQPSGNAPASAPPSAEPSGAPIRENLAPPPGRTTADNGIVWDSPRPASATPPTGRGRECREFQQQVRIDGKLQMAHGTACRQADGSWRIVD